MQEISSRQAEAHPAPAPVLSLQQSELPARCGVSASSLRSYRGRSAGDSGPGGPLQHSNTGKQRASLAGLGRVLHVLSPLSSLSAPEVGVAAVTMRTPSAVFLSLEGPSNSYITTPSTKETKTRGTLTFKACI
ncbi:hypothetical protein NDU88_005533 [Pleurodeles waltl]|uniref:Uncharacterized protein n=1 Tax=Pleurodeles waltl TaxID=8319 RepID=A0AAV7NSJ6_PLEWA|nr:hypothetical protein NDU88_005533 [Pleurodeles waltl]